MVVEQYKDDGQTSMVRRKQNYKTCSVCTSELLRTQSALFIFCGHKASVTGVIVGEIGSISSDAYVLQTSALILKQWLQMKLDDIPEKLSIP